MMLGSTLGIRGIRGVRRTALRLFAVAMALGASALLIGGPAAGVARAAGFNPFSPSGGASPSSGADTSGVTTKQLDEPPATFDQNQFVVDISDAPTVTEGTAGQNKTATFTVTLSQPSPRVVSLAFSTLSGTATSGQDFLSKSGNLFFQPGETQKTITVTVLSNATPADLPTEFFYVNINSIFNAVIGRSVGRADIIDNAKTPPTKVTLNVSDAADVFESKTGAPPTSVFKVSLSKASTTTIKVQYSTANGTAKAGVDYKSTSGTLTFNPGQTSKFVNVKIIKDKVPNQPNPKTFFLNIFNPQPSSTAQIGDVRAGRESSSRRSLTNATVGDGSSIAPARVVS